jgi:hypothetical protein
MPSTSPSPLPVRRRRVTGLRVSAFDSRLGPTTAPSVTSRLTDAYRSLVPGLEDRMNRLSEALGDALSVELCSGPSAAGTGTSRIPPVSPLRVTDLSWSVQTAPDWGALMASRAPHRMLSATP